ncbi:hypothetical protein [Moorena sp. SIO3I6]|uniref:hypothetical protein n=1 Tax=Moorena sp. SIO3I6 TaxID=2607831 RepID=UPI0013FCC552|nr:hypothetical protein [Moorena sp. SIO3I6]NEP27882.1 hypothetical protein [Moorena sp. SIO3I6]
MLINRAPDAWHYFINYELSVTDVTILEKTLLELHKNIAKVTGSRKSGVRSRESETVNYYYCSRFPVPDSRFPVPDSRFPIPDSRFPVPDSRFPIPDSPLPLFSPLQTIQLLG